MYEGKERKKEFRGQIDELKSLSVEPWYFVQKDINCKEIGRWKAD